MMTAINMAGAYDAHLIRLQLIEERQMAMQDQFADEVACAAEEMLGNGQAIYDAAAEMGDEDFKRLFFILASAIGNESDHDALFAARDELRQHFMPYLSAMAAKAVRAL
jgi:uncharacterized protein with gpF-like domain